MSTFYSFLSSYDILLNNADLVMLTFVGLVANFGNRYGQWFWQCVMMYILYTSRFSDGNDDMKEGAYELVQGGGILPNLDWLRLDLRVGGFFGWDELNKAVFGK
jgi:hypothetical protein